MKKFLKNVPIVLLSLLFVQCSAPENETSELNWAHLPLMPGWQNWLINVEPHKTIRVCSNTNNMETMSIKAIKEWAASIKRAEYLNIVGCNQSSRADVTVNVREQDNSSVGVANPAQRMMTISHDVGRVSNGRVKSQYQVVLHEVGHLWGLCDLYPPSYTQCSREYNDGNRELALMWGGGKPQIKKILKDDVDGLQALSERSDFPANAVWKNFLRQNEGRERTSSSPIFAAISSTGDGLVRLWIAAKGANVSHVKMCEGASASCTSAGDGLSPFSYQYEKAGVRFFKSEAKLRINEGRYSLIGVDRVGSTILEKTIKIEAKS